MSYPEVYILGRQVDGVYVEYSEPYLSKKKLNLISITMKWANQCHMMLALGKF